MIAIGLAFLGLFLFIAAGIFWTLRQIALVYRERWDRPPPRSVWGKAKAEISPADWAAVAKDFEAGAADLRKALLEIEGEGERLTEELRKTRAEKIRRHGVPEAVAGVPYPLASPDALAVERLIAETRRRKP